MDDRNKHEPGEDVKNFRSDSNYGSSTISYNDHLPLWYIKSRNAIYYVLGVIEVLLAFRFLFKFLGANQASGFVSLIYTITGILSAPFKGIFSSFATEGLSARSVFEPSDIIAFIVYAIIAWGLVKLIRLKAVRDGH
ncbi:MAG: YggT family protein [Ruminiclostridium sp.]|nr:YggT family protein [Ruminiclostridium sp.]